jgi:hypothetical protein
LDQWLETGRQLVDGVSGARPGRRSGVGARSGRSAPASLDAVGRWMGEKIDWLLDEDDDWREPWDGEAVAPSARSRDSSQPGSPSPSMPVPERWEPTSVRGKRPLQAISRRQPPLVASTSQPPAPQSVRGAGDDGWPTDDSFRLDRWSRSSATSSTASSGTDPGTTSTSSAGLPSQLGSAARSGGNRRPLPRSSRRRA